MDNEVEKQFLDEQKKQTRILKQIRVGVFVLLGLVGAYVLFRITVGSLFSQIIGAVAGIFS